MASKIAPGRWSEVLGAIFLASRSWATRAACQGACLIGGAANALHSSLTREEQLLHHEDRVLRQPLVNRLIHWGVALSCLLLILSGFGQMPLYKRYMVSDLPGLAWTSDFASTLQLHYAGAIILMLAASFHVTYHGLRGEFGFLPRRGDLKQSLLIIRAILSGGKEPPAEKYLAEQRLAYAAIAASILMLIVTGMVKVAKNLAALDVNSTLVAVSTHLHNLGMMILLLTIAGHLLAFAIPANRKLVPGMIRGKVDLDYVKHRHCLWCDKLARQTRTVTLPEES